MDDQNVQAIVDLLTATKRDLQLVDKHISALAGRRPALDVDDDVPSEHRVAFLGVTDDNDGLRGILFSAFSDAANFGLMPNTKHTGTIRNDDDAAFVVTDVLMTAAVITNGALLFFENPEGPPTVSVSKTELALRLTDQASGRSLITGMTQGPQDLDRGVVPLPYLSAIRPGLGSAFKNSLFSEYTVPRGGTVRAEVFNMATATAEDTDQMRVFVTLLGFKVYGA